MMIHLYFRHPVISTFLWRKWQSICKDVRQNLRSSAIFTITATRAILTAYDVKLSNSEAISGNIVEKNMTSQSCHYQNNWLWSPTEGFNMDLESASDHIEFGFWVTALQCLWLLLLILRCKILSNSNIHGVILGTVFASFGKETNLFTQCKLPLRTSSSFSLASLFALWGLEG